VFGQVSVAKSVQPPAEVHNTFVILWLVLLLLVLSSAYWGWYLGLSLLADPDTCFLLGTGRYILEHGLPARDVFSWTLAASDRAPILYQWLSEVSFYLLFQGGGALALILSSTALLFGSFIVVPYLVSRRFAAGSVPTLFVSSLAFMAGSFHFFLRPELVSYILLSMLYFGICLYFEKLLSANWQEPLKYRLALTFSSFIFFAFWANCHTGFFAGLIVLAILSVVAAVMDMGKFFLGASAASSANTASRPEGSDLLSAGAGGKLLIVAQDSALALFGVFVGSFAQPYGFQLYRHIFSFFSVSDKNVELAGLTWRELIFFGSFRPFTLLLLLFITVASVNLFKLFAPQPDRVEKSDTGSGSASGFASGSASSSALKILNLALLLLTAISILLSLLCRRLVPFAAISETFYFVVAARTLGLSHFQEAIAKFTAGRRRLLALLPVCALILGASTSARAFHVHVPQDSSSFLPPEAAIKFLEKARPVGRMLNDPQFGDVLIFRLGAGAQNFIDTRFDLYGEKLTNDFWKMANGLENWRELLDQYKIDWVFLIPDYRLIRLLNESGKWQEVYRDPSAVIMSRREPFAGRLP
jgi:hypothetical protein